MLRNAVVSYLAFCLLVMSAVSVDVSDEVYSDYVEERVQDKLLQQQRTVNNSAQPRSNRVLQKRSKAGRYNVALNRPTWQSSLYTFSPTHKLTPNLANDGKMKTNIGSCAHTLPEINPWWAVDLRSPLVIDSVDFTSRADCCAHQAANFIVGLTDVSPAVKAPTLWNYDVCGQWKGSPPLGTTVHLKCVANIPARRYLVVQVPHSKPNYMHVCELRVYERRCPINFTYVPSTKGCYAVVTENLQWSIAGLRCRSLHKDAHLVVISSGTEQSAVAGLLASTNRGQLTGCHKDVNGYYFWTAGQRINPETASPFIWRVTTTNSGADVMSEMQYTNWNTGQPNYNADNEPCVHMMGAHHYAWGNVKCTARICAVCEIGS